jgi:hypothetical protein
MIRGQVKKHSGNRLESENVESHLEETHSCTLLKANTRPSTANPYQDWPLLQPSKFGESGESQHYYRSFLVSPTRCHCRRQCSILMSDVGRGSSYWAAYEHEDAETHLLCFEDTDLMTSSKICSRLYNGVLIA